MYSTKRQHFANAYTRLWNYIVLSNWGEKPSKEAWSVLVDQLHAYSKAKDKPSRPAAKIDHGPGTGKRIQYLPDDRLAPEMQRLDPYAESRYSEHV